LAGEKYEEPDGKQVGPKSEKYMWPGVNTEYTFTVNKTCYKQWINTSTKSLRQQQQLKTESIKKLNFLIKVKIYRSIIFPVVLYGFETWSLTLREERRLSVFENRVFGPKRDEITGNGENYIMRILVVCTRYPILYGW
jgi:hypothetical protein